jgi:rhodanese-related sulfurtransferase
VPAVNGPPLHGADSVLERLAGHIMGAAAGTLVLGDAWSSWAEALAARGAPVRHAVGDWPAVQLDERFAVVVVNVGVGAPASPEDRAAVVHCAVQHALPGAFVVTSFGPTLFDLLNGGDRRGGDAALAERFDLAQVCVVECDGRVWAIHRRTERFTVHDLVFQARSTIRRIQPAELAARMRSERPPVVIDTRTHTDRFRFGVIDGALHIPRTVLEWHLDPANGYRHPLVRSFDQPLVVVCNGGYSSSLAAANLVTLGFTDVVDLIGGHFAWVHAGLPVTTPDHSHLDV